jgi:ADP-heptose:LPS heptosyltransferase
LLLHCEQGFGETIQFARFVPLAARRGGHVMLETVGELAPLLARSFREIEVFVRGTRVPPHDYQCALPSLPAVLGASLIKAPGQTPYLVPDAAAVETWRQRLGGLPRPWIGFCWRGNPRFVDDRRRSPGLAMLKETVAASASLVSLTKAPTEADRLSMRTILDASADLATFDDTAALIAALDLVITSDTAIAHLAGGLGQKTWVMLAHAADWRWLQNRTDVPWYPSATLFRQPRPGDWAAVDRAVAAALRNLR